MLLSYTVICVYLAKYEEGNEMGLRIVINWIFQNFYYRICDVYFGEGLL